MKSKQYVKKYDLGQGVNFNHNEFIADMVFDFMSMIEWEELRGEFNLGKFDQVVTQMRDKWEGINNKTLGILPEKLWKYFYATVVVELKSEKFPELEKQRQDILNMNNRELERVLSNQGISVSIGFGFNVAWDRQWGQAHDLNNRFVFIALREAERRKMKRQNQEAEELQKRAAQWKKEKEARRNFWEGYGHTSGDSSFFGGILSGILKGMSAPIKALDTLNISEDATEDDVKKAYRKLSLKHHPDKGGNQQKFIELTEAKNKCLAYVSNR